MEYTSLTIEQLTEKLDNGTVRFAFEKVGGNLRIALGTRSLSMIPSQFHPKGKRKVDVTLPYFDLEKMCWRSISKLKKIYQI